MFPKKLKVHLNALQSDINALEKEVNQAMNRVNSVSTHGKTISKRMPINEGKTQKTGVPNQKNCHCKGASIVIHTCAYKKKTDTLTKNLKQCTCLVDKATDTRELKSSRSVDKSLKKKDMGYRKCGCSCKHENCNGKLKKESSSNRNHLAYEGNQTWADIFISSHNDSLDDINQNKKKGSQNSRNTQTETGECGCSCSSKNIPPAVKMLRRGESKNLDPPIEKPLVVKNDSSAELAKKLKLEVEGKDRIIKKLEDELAKINKRITKEPKKEVHAELETLRAERDAIRKEAVLHQISSEKLKILLEGKDLHVNLFQRGTEAFQKRLLERLQLERQKRTESEIEKIILQVQQGAPDLSIISNVNQTLLGNTNDKDDDPCKCQDDIVLSRNIHESINVRDTPNISANTELFNEAVGPLKHSSPRSKTSLQDIEKAFDGISAINTNDNFNDTDHSFVPI